MALRFSGGGGGGGDGGPYKYSKGNLQLSDFAGVHDPQFPTAYSHLWILHAGSQVLYSDTLFLNTVSVLPHPPYSPGLALFVFSFSETKISSRVADILTEMLWSQLFFPLYQDYAKKTIKVLFLKLDERLKLYIKIKIRG